MGYLRTLQGLSLLLTTFRCLHRFQYNDLFIHVSGSQCYRSTVVNELSNFNFSIHYKPGIENVLADSLSRYPFLQECNLEQYSQHLNPDEVKSVFDAVVNQVGNNETWVAAVNTTNTVFNDTENEILYDVEDLKITLASRDTAQKIIFSTFSARENMFYLHLFSI